MTSYNYGPSYIRQLHKKLSNISPGNFTKKFIQKLNFERDTAKYRRLKFNQNR